MKKLVAMAMFLVLSGIPFSSQAGTATRSGRISGMLFRDWRTSSARFFVSLANVTNICGNGASAAYLDAVDPNASEAYRALEAAFLAGKTVTLTMTVNTSTCRIETFDIAM